MKQLKKLYIAQYATTLLLFGFLLYLPSLNMLASNNNDVTKSWWQEAKISFQNAKKWVADKWNQLTNSKHDKDLKDCPKAPSYITKKDAKQNANNSK